MRSLALLLLVCLAASPALAERKFNGVHLPRQVQVEEHTLLLNGAGVRSKWFLDVYVASLYLEPPSKDSREIIEGERPFLLQLDIVSGLITSKKMEKATREGFEKAARAGYDTAAKQVDAFIDVFREEIGDGDRFLLRYLPAVGVQVEKNGSLKATLTGLPFKKALLAIWLGSEPVQESLKRELLGQ